MFDHTERRDLAIIFSILFVALFLRVYQLGFESLWWDELFTWKLVQLSVTDMAFAVLHDFNPPLYYFLLSTWTFFFGYSTEAIRLLSVLFSMLSVYFVYRLGYLFNKRTGQIASFLTAISLIQITYAQEARFYALFTFMSILSVYYFLRYLESEEKDIKIFYIASTTFLLYSHVYAVFLVSTQLFYMIYLVYKDSLSVEKFKNGLIPLILYIPWLLVSIVDLIRINTNEFWIPAPDLDTLKDTITFFSSGEDLKPLYIILIVLSTLNFSLLNKYFDKISKENILKLKFMWAWITITIVAPFALSFVLQPIYQERYVINASIPFYILASYGISRIPDKYTQMAVIGGITLITLNSLAGDYYNTHNNENWVETVNKVEKNSTNDTMVVYNDHWVSYAFEKYGSNQEIEFVSIPQENWFDLEKGKKYFISLEYKPENRFIDGEDIENLEKELTERQPEEVWLVLSRERGETEQLTENLKEKLELKEKDEKPDIKLYKFE